MKTQKAKQYLTVNHFHSIFKLFYVLQDFSFTTSERMRDNDL